MRVLENLLSNLIWGARRRRDSLQATLEQRGFQQAHLEAMQLRHDLMAMLITARNSRLREAEVG